MALLRGPYGTSQIKGSIGAVTFQQGRYGLIARGRTVPVNPNTLRQNDVRQSFREVSTLWSSNILSIPGLLAFWQAYAEATPWTNKFGDTVTLAARSHFLRIASFLRNAGVALVDIPSSPPTIPGLPPPNDLTISGDTTNGLRITGVNPTLNPDDHTQILVSAPVTPIRNFWNGPYAFTYYIDSATTYPSNLIGAGLLAIGQRYFVQVRSSIADGGLSTVYSRPIDVTT